jgi:uncharacterized membrane protein YedE/YeeE
MIAFVNILSEHAAAALLLGGLAIGIVFGAVVQRTGFCTLGALSDVTLFGDARRLRSWLLAIAVAVAGAQALHAANVVDLNLSLYRSAQLSLGGHVLGGLLFGLGMPLAGGCVSRNLVRAGAGDLRSLLTLLVLAAVVSITLGGLLGTARVAFLSATSIPAPPFLEGTAAVAAGSILALVLLVVCFADAAFRVSRPHIAAGIAVGLCVTAGWALTGLAYDAFADTPAAPVSLTFVKPTADTLDWMKRSTALDWPGFAVMSVLGTLAGAWLAAVSSGTFRLATFAGPEDTLRHIAGAGLMAIGGVLALGCSIGQGITGVSTLAPGSAITLLAIAGGAIGGLKLMERYST